MEKHYHKLVRDKIPGIIEAGGQRCAVRVLAQEEYLQKLEEKLSEELTEYRESGALEELADLYEVMLALLDAKGLSKEALEAAAENKRLARGGFRDRILLETVY